VRWTGGGETPPIGKAHTNARRALKRFLAKGGAFHDPGDSRKGGGTLATKRESLFRKIEKREELHV